MNSPGDAQGIVGGAGLCALPPQLWHGAVHAAAAAATAPVCHPGFG